MQQEIEVYEKRGLLLRPHESTLCRQNENQYVVLFVSRYNSTPTTIQLIRASDSLRDDT